MRIAVGVTSYNQATLLVEAIDSALAQRVRPHEIIIVDDASSDNSQDVIRSYAAQYPGLIKPIFHEQNQGVSQARNSILRQTASDCITMLDGDDCFLPEKLEREAALLMQKPDTALVYSDFYFAHQDGTYWRRWAQDPMPQGHIFDAVVGLEFPNVALFRSELVRVAHWQAVGFYDPALMILEDYDMRIRLTQTGKVGYTGQPLSTYRMVAGSLSSRGLLEHVKLQRFIFNKNRPLYGSLSQTRLAQIEARLRAHWASLLRKGLYQELSANQWGRAYEAWVLALRMQPKLSDAYRLGRLVLAALPRPKAKD